MTPQSLPILSLVLLLFPMTYFLFTSPTFLLVRLDVPQVRWLMRIHFNGFLILLTCTAVVSTVAAAASDRAWLTILPASVLVLASAGRRWFLARFDAQMAAQDAGDPDATWRMRRLHVGGMLCNAAALAVVIAEVNPVLGSLG